jgi:hypothetical protein
LKGGLARVLRTLLVVALIAVGGLLTVPGSIGVWQDRAILDEDAFVDTVDEAFEKEEVQTALANRLTNVIMEHLEIRDRIAEGLAEVERRGGERTPEGLLLLEGPLTGVARDAVYRVALRLIEEQPLEEARETALRGAHRALVAIINEDVAFLTRRGEEVILDLSIIVEEIVREVGGERADAFLESAELPPDAGVIVLTEKSDISIVWDVMDFLDKYYPVWAGVALVLFAIAVAVASNRRRTLIWVGAMLAVVAAIEILVVAQPLKESLTDAVAEPEGNAAARATYDVLVDSFKRQEAFVILIGVGLVAGGTLAGESELARAVRSTFRRREIGAEEVGLGDWIGKRALPLRIGGLALVGLFLIGWPDPSTRLTVTVMVLAALYLAALALATSDAGWAVATRSWVGQLWERYFRVPEAAAADRATRGRSPLRWAAARAPWFRSLGVAVGVVLLIAWPSLTFGTVVIVVALELLYLAAIDVIVSRAAD